MKYEDKGYISHLWRYIHVSGLFIGVWDDFIEVLPLLGSMLRRIFFIVTLPLWFFPLTYWDYRYERKRDRKAELGGYIKRQTGGMQK